MSGAPGFDVRADEPLEEGDGLLDAEALVFDLVGQCEHGVDDDPHDGARLEIVAAGAADESGPAPEDALPEFSFDARQFGTVPTGAVDESTKNAVRGVNVGLSLDSLYLRRRRRRASK